MKMSKRMLVYSGVILLLAAVVFAVDEKGVMDTMKAEGAKLLTADTNTSAAKPAPAMDANACPKAMKIGPCCQMTPDQKMKCCGMSPAMVDKCTMMMNAQIMPTDPAAMMAMKDKLMLTPEQIDKLDMIAKKARADAAMVLTAPQNDMIKAMDTSPATMMEMHKMMMQKMKEKGMMAPADKMGAMNMEQTKCPMTGMPINKKYSTQYKGKTVYFCSAMCKVAFDQNPEKYIDKLPQFQQ